MWPETGFPIIIVRSKQTRLAGIRGGVRESCGDRVTFPFVLFTSSTNTVHARLKEKETTFLNQCTTIKNLKY